jgi:hypothetical protein
MDSLYTTTYIGNKPGSQDIYTHAETIDNILTIESAVLAGSSNVHRNRNCNRNFGNYLMSELKVNKVTPRSGTLMFRCVEKWHPVGGLVRNIIINGDMSIAQRGTCASCKSTAGYLYM